MNQNSKIDRGYVDFVFWAAHVCCIAPIIGGALAIDDEYIPVWSAPVFLIGCILFAGYYILIGLYANRIGRSGIIWGGLAFITGFFGVWGTYIASFIVKPIENDEKF